MTGKDEMTSIIMAHLDSDDQFQIRSSGDYEQVRVKIGYDIELSFLFDSLNDSNKLLIVDRLIDLKITRSSNQCPLDKDQWTNMCEYFNRLLQQPKESTSLSTLIQSIRDYLIAMMKNNQKLKRKQKKPAKLSEDENASMMTNRFRHSDLIFHRILHDKSIDRSQVMIGYEDRFTGIHEILFNEFKRVHEHEVSLLHQS